MPVLIENGHPINCLALRALRSLGLPVDRDKLYALQLMQWALEKREIIDRRGVEATVAALLEVLPRRALNYITGYDRRKAQNTPFQNRSSRPSSSSSTCWTMWSVIPHDRTSLLTSDRQGGTGGGLTPCSSAPWNLIVPAAHLAFGL